MRACSLSVWFHASSAPSTITGRFACTNRDTNSADDSAEAETCGIEWAEAEEAGAADDVDASSELMAGDWRLAR